MRGVPAFRGISVAFWVLMGFLVGLGTSIGARVLLCPHSDDVRGSPPPAIAPRPAQAPASLAPEATAIDRMETARAILTAVVESDGIWTEAHRLELQKEVALLPEEGVHEIVREMIVAIHSGKLHPE